MNLEFQVRGKVWFNEKYLLQKEMMKMINQLILGGGD